MNRKQFLGTTASAAAAMLLSPRRITAAPSSATAAAPIEQAGIATWPVPNLTDQIPQPVQIRAHSGVSSRYTFVSTAQVVALLAAEGWAPVKASEQRVRLESRIGLQPHEVRFTRRADLDTATWQVGSTRAAELILQNAHDGTHAYRIDAGLYRMVCRNGLTVAETEFAHVSIRHVDASAHAFLKAAQSVGERTPQVMRTVAKWQGVQLSEAQRI